MRATRSPILLAALALAACHDRPATPAAPSVTQPSAEVLQALAVWQLGAEAIPVSSRPLPQDGEVVSWSSEGPTTPFREFDGDVAAFLAHPSLASAVQFSCVPELRGREAWLSKGLKAEDPLVRLRALTALVRVRAPRSVAEQWAVLSELSAGKHAAEFAPVTEQVSAVFDAAAIDIALMNPPLLGKYTAPATYQWAIRAAGVIRHRPALPRLTELSCSDSLLVSLAAARSLRDFEGPDANAALAECVRGWQYNASLGAAHALLARDPELLRATLLASESPVDMLCYKGILLARLEDSRAVPLLCETVPHRAIMDREMFDAIERLAMPEHLAVVDALPGRVRQEQRDRATTLVQCVRARLGLPR